MKHTVCLTIVLFIIAMAAGKFTPVQPAPAETVGERIVPAVVDANGNAAVAVRRGTSSQ
jgi:hypothetical protein